MAEWLALRPSVPRLRTLALGMAIALGLAGCAATPPAPPVADTQGALPALALPIGQGVSVEPGLAIDRWWALFGDADLDRLIDDALRQNHDLAAAAARVREARALLDEQHGARGPALLLEASSGRSRQSAEGLPPGAERHGSRHGVSLAARYELDLWGRLAAADDAARQRLLAESWARAGIQWSLTAQLAEAHFSLRALERQVAISDAVRASRAATLDLRRREHAAGATPEFELRRAEAELADTGVSLAALRRQRIALEATLALLAGRPLAQASAADAPRAALDSAQPFTARLPQGDAAALLLRRPDVRQAEARLAAAQADIAAARAATLPAVRLSGSVGSDVRSLSGLFSGPGFVWSLALGAVQSVFDGGQATARVAQSDARADAALAAYRQAVLAAVLEVREAYAALDLARQAHEAGQQRVAALERSRRLAQAGVDAGALARIDVLDAERNSYAAQLAEVDAYRDRLIGQVAAFKSLGGGLAGLAATATE